MVGEAASGKRVLGVGDCDQVRGGDVAGPVRLALTAKRIEAHRVRREAGLSAD